MKKFNIKRLPALIRDKVVVAYKSAKFPAAYEYALVALQEAVDDCDLEKIKTLEVCADTLASIAMASQDSEAILKVKQLKLANYRAAHIIAKLLFAKEKSKYLAEYQAKISAIKAIKKDKRAGNGVNILTHHLPLREAGFSREKRVQISAVGRLTDQEFSAAIEKGKTPCVISKERAGRNRSDGWGRMFTSKHGGYSPFAVRGWFSVNNARGLAKKISPEEKAEAKERVAFVRAWCDEFLRNL